MRKIARIGWLIMILALSINGCGVMKKKETLTVDQIEEIAKENLEEKYSQKFKLERIWKRSTGMFSTREYMGYAYIESHPEEKFSVWIDRRGETVEDSYDCIYINRETTKFLQNTAEGVWKNVDVRFESLMASRPKNDLGKYSDGNIREYFEEEFSNNNIYIVVEQYSDNEAKRIEQFKEEISFIENGLIYITYEDCDNKGQLSISLAADTEDIIAQIKKWE